MIRKDNASTNAHHRIECADIRMNKWQRAKYNGMTLRELRSHRDYLNELVAEFEKSEPRWIDVLFEHHDPNLVAQVLRLDGDPNSSDWRQLERIYCCAQRCPQCPHGDHWFRYRRNKRKGTVTRKYSGTAYFPFDVMERMRAQARELNARLGPGMSGSFVLVPKTPRT